MKRAPNVCPHWSDGEHGDVRVCVWRRFRRRVVKMCPRCGGWWDEVGTLAEHNRNRRHPMSGTLLGFHVGEAAP